MRESLRTPALEAVSVFQDPALPLTCDLRGPHASAVLISHPGWTRRYFSEEDNRDLSEWSAARLLSSARLASAAPDLDTLQEVLLPKIWMAERGKFGELYLEIIGEHALALAQHHRLPVIVTIPSRMRVSTGDAAFVPFEHPTQTFGAYLRTVLRGCADVYALPTEPDSGALIGYPHAELTDERLMTWGRSPLGERLLAPLCAPHIAQLKFSGGFFDQCLRNTVTQLLTRTPISILDNLALSSGLEDFNAEALSVHGPGLPEDLARVLEDTVWGADCHEARRGILDRFRILRGSLNAWGEMGASEHSALETLAPGLGTHLNLLSVDFLPEPGAIPLHELFARSASAHAAHR